MRIGFIVDGEAEYRSLPVLIENIESSHTLLSPLLADIQPLSSTRQIAGAVKKRLPILIGKNVHLVIVLVDRETRDVCPGAWAQELTAVLRQHCGGRGKPDFAVVIKDACYENWLISDTTVFSKMKERFSVSRATIRSIRPNKADSVDAQRVLRNATRGASYSKVADAARIMSRADPLQMAANSRSFRRFLRIVAHPSYSDQSRNPV